MQAGRPPRGRESRVLALALAGMLLLAGGCAGRDRAPAAAPAQLSTIGVNAWLWRASLDTLQFMPLASVDSAGGVVVTDWYQNPAEPGERARVSVAILDSQLRADAVQVSANRQVLSEGRWVEVPVRAGTVQRLEEVILERARNLRQAASAR